MRTIVAVTAARSDYGILQPVLMAINQHPSLKLRLLVTGMHLSPAFGSTVHDIERDGFDIAERIEVLLASDSPVGIASSMGLATLSFAQAYQRVRPDILLMLGDRFEMHAAAVASLPFAIPIAHIHGGESTQGNIDEAFRHSLTKMSHIHFVANQTYAKRVVQMGEDPQRVFVSGAPGLDQIKTVNLMNRDELRHSFGLELSGPFLLVTFHPVTLEYEQTQYQVEVLLQALRQREEQIVFTYPNADTSSRSIISAIESYCRKHKRAQLAASLGTRGYFSLMAQATAMVGNSSSGIIEAASFRLPVVNIGLRQAGRVRGPNVLDVPVDKLAIVQAISQATSTSFQQSIASCENPYGDGNASPRIVERLADVDLGKQLLQKKFYDLKDLPERQVQCG